MSESETTNEVLQAYSAPHLEVIAGGQAEGKSSNSTEYTGAYGIFVGPS